MIAQEAIRLTAKIFRHPIEFDADGLFLLNFSAHVRGKCAALNARGLTVPTFHILGNVFSASSSGRILHGYIPCDGSCFVGLDV